MNADRSSPSLRARVTIAREPPAAARLPAGEWTIVGQGRELHHGEGTMQCDVRLPFGHAAIARNGARTLVVVGSPAFEGRRDDAVASLGAALARDPADALARLTGPFIVLYVDGDAGTLAFATDRAATRSPCYAVDGDRVTVGITAQDVLSARGRASDVRLQAICDYLDFHVIPAPQTLFEGVLRLLPGHWLRMTAGGSPRVEPYWKPNYTVASPPRSFAEAKRVFRDLLHAAVAESAGDQAAVGTFLSGGTDSSTVAGMLGVVRGEPAATYSIGFDVPGFDEIGYARIAAAHFATRQHEYYLTPDDLLATIPALARGFDQPFGNSSAIAAYFCARLAAADGVARLLGGDGGDEIFGGNTRYARQKLFEPYRAVPAWVRNHVIGPVLGHRGVQRAALARKAQSYVEQAAMPMPARMHAYNLLEQVGAARMLTADFVAAVDFGAPGRQRADYYALCADRSLVNRMLHYDWKFTLADNDLPKVVAACDLAGIDVRFPFLDERIVEFGNALPARWKVRGLRLRAFFKDALADFLPREIIDKKKHGFGLPFGQWLVAHAGLQRIAVGSLESLRDRGIIRAPFVDEILHRVRTEHAGFYGELVWILMMLEQWLGAHRNDYRLRATDRETASVRAG